MMWSQPLLESGWVNNGQCQSWFIKSEISEGTTPWHHTTSFPKRQNVLTTKPTKQQWPFHNHFSQDYRIQAVCQQSQKTGGLWANGCHWVCVCAESRRTRSLRVMARPTGARNQPFSADLEPKYDVPSLWLMWTAARWLSVGEYLAWAFWHFSGKILSPQCNKALYADDPLSGDQGLNLWSAKLHGD